MSQAINFQKSALETLRIEQQALEVLATQINESFDRACEILLQCKGRVVVTGMGKSGHIGRKWQRHLHQLGHHHFLCTQVKRGMVIWVCWCVVMFDCDFKFRQK
jgi:arabinose-5-phosphate isomerase